MSEPHAATDLWQSPESDLWHSLLVEEVIRRMASRPSGLTAAEATERLARLGRNELPRRTRRAPIELLVRQFASFFVLVLLFAAALATAVSFIPHESDCRLTAAFILAIVTISVALSFFEEFRAQRELDAIAALLRTAAVVMRDGMRQEIEAAAVVPGDILLLAQGQRVTAPALLGSYAVAVGVQLLALYTPLRGLFGIVPLGWDAWAVMIPVVGISSFVGVYMTRWILRLVPLWE